MNRKILFLCYQLISLHSCQEPHVPSLLDLKCFFDIECQGTKDVKSSGSDYSNVPEKRAELFVTIHGSDQLMALGEVVVPKPEG